MAEFTDQDKETLDKLRKESERTGKTTSLRDPWQERMVHNSAIRSRSILAANVLEGFAGSWAASYKYGWGGTVNPVGTATEEPEFLSDSQAGPTPIRARINHLGFRGPPEINFAPFDGYTNKFGSKGPSLIGHPISFEVVGPTLKSNYCDWTWTVSESGGADGGDSLTMSLRADGGAATSNTLANGYNLADFTMVDEPNGGLYLLVTDDGDNPGSIPAGRVPMAANSVVADTAKFELFRISGIRLNTIDLHPSKRLADYFDLPGLSIDRSVRAITLVRPYVTRLQAHPGTGAGLGREQTFSILIPEFSASSDLYPPYNSTLGPAWRTGGFNLRTAPNDPGLTGSVASGVYGGKMRLPIPQPVREGTGGVEVGVGAPTLPIGTWFVSTSISGLSANQVLRVYNTQREDILSELNVGQIQSCLGWFPILNLVPPNGAQGLVLVRNAEVDPQTGLIFWGPGPYIDSTATSGEVGLQFTVHNPISSIWLSASGGRPVFNIDQVEASTLRNLIDPKWVGRFEKQVSELSAVGGTPPAGTGAGQPDKAIFNTGRNPAAVPIPDVENPGNLMDLGFRVVLFPAKEEVATGDAIPDFDNPIYTREVIIDGSVSEKQFIEVDYSAGLVRLSHPPPTSRGLIPDEPSQIIPNGIPGSTTNNQREEVVLFAACVPYSMEDSQVGTGNRITTNAGPGAPDQDLYSTTGFAKLELAEMTFTGAAPFIGASTYGTVDLVLDRLVDWPSTGVVTITAGSASSIALGRWGYTEIRTETATTGVLVTVLSGISSGPVTADPDPSLVGGSATRGVVLRREVEFGVQSLSTPTLTDFYPSDTTYGNAARAGILRFGRSSLTPNMDGSVTVNPRPDLGSVLDRPLSTLVPSKNPQPANLVDNAGPFTTRTQYFSETGFFNGMRYQSEPTDPRGGSPGGEWVQTASISTPTLMLKPRSGGAAPLWHGVITPNLLSSSSEGVISMMDNFRLVVKLEVDIRFALPTAGPKLFVGFVQDESGPGLQATIGTPAGQAVTDLSTLFPSFTGLGFYLDGATDTAWRFWHRGAGGPDVFTTTAATVVGAIPFEGPWYMVIESNPQFYLAASSVVAKIAIYDKNKILLSSQTMTNAATLPVVLGRGLVFAAGVREEVIPTVGDSLHIHHVSMSSDINPDDLPPIP